MELRQIQISLNAQVGPLNEVRRQRIMESLGGDFSVQPVPFQGALALVNPVRREALFLTDNQIQFTVEGQPAEFSAHRLEHVLSTVRDTLLLEDRFPMLMQVIAHKDANGSAFERTVDAFTPIPPHTMRQYFPGLRGLGIRITFEEHPYVCDLRVEPLFSDPAYLFIQFNLGSQQAMMSVSTLTEEIYQWMNRLQNEYNAIIDTIMGE
ncbi:MAG: hypothetical protein SNJ72_05380 [Fimbriimonadales bacterium]